VFCQDSASGLRAVIAIYSTALGPHCARPSAVPRTDVGGRSVEHGGFVFAHARRRAVAIHDTTPAVYRRSAAGGNNPERDRRSAR
jgi:hypothetical protein